jgi:undecaprenyl pyrophosphate phosphatase UppP
VVRGGMDAGEAGVFAAGIVASALAGFVAIWGLLRLLERAGVTAFVVYRFVFGIGLLLLVAAGFR